jgi:hypothetical protein
MFAGQLIVHADATFTWNVHWAVLPDESVAVHVTVVEPTLKQVPDGGVQLAVAPGQLSVGVGVAYVTFAQPEPGGFSIVEILPGQVIDGA